MKDISGQISLFDTFGQSDKTNTDIQSYLKEAIMRGTGFENGVKRVYGLYQKNMAPSERVQDIKKLYGIGGAGWPIEGYGLRGYNSLNNGITVEWRDEIGEHEKTFTWNEVERAIQGLVKSGDYYKNV